MLGLFTSKANVKSSADTSLKGQWNVRNVRGDGVLETEQRLGFMFELEGLDGAFFSTEQLTMMHNDWRSVLRLQPGEELQVVFRKRVEFADWVENQLNQSFLAENAYGRQILIDRLSDKLSEMSEEQPRLLSQKIVACFWTSEKLDEDALADKRLSTRHLLASFGFGAQSLDRQEVEREINISAQNLKAGETQEPEWPALHLSAGALKVNDDQFRALELVKLPETFSELGMIQSITMLPYPMDICVRLKARDLRPVTSRLEKKRNLLNAQRGSKNSPSPKIEEQMTQIDDLLRQLASKSESIFDMSLTVGLRMPQKLHAMQKKALGNLMRAGSRLDFAEFEEPTLSLFDSYLECIPGFFGRNIKSHTVLGSNAAHFLPFFRPAQGDQNAVASFETRTSTIFNIDPVDGKLANYNWLVSGTSGAGKSFFVNSLLAQSMSMNPNIFVVDIGGSYNKMTQFLGGRVMSLEPGQGFAMSPFFLAKSDDPKEERMRRQHILNIFLEMVRMDGQLPDVEIRHLLFELVDELLEKSIMPERPISYLIQRLSGIDSPMAHRLSLLLKPWGGSGFYAQFVDNNVVSDHKERILTFDLKGLTEFADLARVIQLIVCASLWARVRRSSQSRFSWIVLDEVAFSLLKTQPEFVDELVSTLRKHFAGAIVVVQDLEKITSNLAGSSILQNTQSKAILQQRGDPRNYAEALSLNSMDQWAIESLRREKGNFSDIFLIRDDVKTVIRHRPSELEYWLSTTAPEDTLALKKSLAQDQFSFQDGILKFVAKQKVQG